MEQKQTKAFIEQAIGLVGLLLGLAATVFLINFIGQAFSTKIADWGSFGDYFGGIMNPVVACAALFLLAKSLRIQHKELSDTREALTKASESQAEQARLAAQHAKIEAIKMSYEKTNIDLQSVLSYQQSLLDIANTGRDIVINQRGEHVKLSSELYQVDQRVSDLVLRQNQAIIDTYEMIDKEKP